MAEVALVCGLYLWLVLRLGHDFLITGKVIDLLYLGGEAVPAVLIILRRPALRYAAMPADWAACLVATGLPLLVGPGGRTLLPAVVCGAAVFLGFGLQLWAKLGMGRRYGLLPANRGIQMAGAYRFIRHPMYAGYLLMDTGFLLANASTRNAVLYVLTNSVQLYRLFAEERALHTDSAYRSYRDRVRWRLFPTIF